MREAPLPTLFDRPLAPGPAPRPARRPLTVSELNAWVRGLLDGSLPAVAVEGEISNLRRYPSGHTYFTLKDAASQVSVVLFRGQGAFLRFRPEDGLKAVVRGRVSLYEARGAYQLVADTLEPAGLGALQLGLEQLKKRLAAEGLLDPARKRPLPLVPRRLGLVTSPRGAALRDILHVLERRFADLEIVLAPVRVQGDGAAIEIALAIAALDDLGDLDVVIVARGGGSIEDLWAFNEEPVARALAASRAPVISAVGHETDVTLADLVADVRAPTPSAAAEMVIVSRQEIARHLLGLERRLASAARLGCARAAERLEQVRPDRALQRAAARLHDAIQKIDDRGARLHAALADHLTRARHRMERGVDRLQALSPLAVLQRGYAVCTDASGTILKDARTAAPGAGVRVRLRRGRLRCIVEESEDVAEETSL
jgi:exodeoxyribonuclease VII large subunit